MIPRVSPQTFSHLCYLFLIEKQLIYKVSGVQKNDSVICIYIYKIGLAKKLVQVFYKTL